MTEEKPQPCSYCLTPAVETCDGWMCQADNCPNAYTTIPCPHNWNYLQNIIMGLRRKDFDNGLIWGQAEPHEWPKGNQPLFDDYIAQRPMKG